VDYQMRESQASKFHQLMIIIRYDGEWVIKAFVHAILQSSNTWVFSKTENEKRRKSGIRISLLPRRRKRKQATLEGGGAPLRRFT
jgi:hypothetical protein